MQNYIKDIKTNVLNCPIPTSDKKSHFVSFLQIWLKTDSKLTIIVFAIYRYREFAPQEYEKRNLIQLPEDDYQAYEPQVPAYQDPNQILFKTHTYSVNQYSNLQVMVTLYLHVCASYLYKYVGPG